MVDKLRDPLLTPGEVSRHLRIPSRTIYRWLAEDADGSPLVHGVQPVRKGWPSVPFVAVVEAYVLRVLRELELNMVEIRDAAAAVRREFDTPYALATKRIVTDGVDIFIESAGELARARDSQRPIRQIIDRHLRYISWQGGPDDEIADRLRLPQYDAATVVIDPRFAWGAPIVEPEHVPVQAIVELLRAGEPPEAVAEEFGLTRDVVESVYHPAAV